MGSERNDPLLFPFLKAPEEAEGEPLLRLFAEHVSPTVRRVLTPKTSHSDRGAWRARDQGWDEIYHDVQLQLLKRLRELKANPDAAPITNLRGYVTATAHNAFDEHLRRRYPRRRSLKDKLRYHLVNEPGLDLWEDADAGWLAGRAACNNRSRPGVAGLNQQALSGLIERTRELLGQTDPQRLSLPDIIRAIFEAAGSPITFDAMTSVAAGLLQVQDHSTETITDEGNLAAPLLTTGEFSDPERMAERHQMIQRIWDEICVLPRRHRIALLFNLRGEGGVNVIALLPLTGVATFAQIAAALEIPVGQFEEIWPDLPMDDLKIADFLDATRQQVINLRKNARGRLRRLLKDFESGEGGRGGRL